MRAFSTIMQSPNSGFNNNNNTLANITSANLQLNASPLRSQTKLLEYVFLHFNPIIDY